MAADLSKGGGLARIPTPDRPLTISFIKAVEKAIDDIAVDNMTPIEVLGALDFVAKNFYNNMDDA